MISLYSQPSQRGRLRLRRGTRRSRACLPQRVRAALARGSRACALRLAQRPSMVDLVVAATDSLPSPLQVVVVASFRRLDSPWQQPHKGPMDPCTDDCEATPTLIDRKAHHQPCLPMPPMPLPHHCYSHVARRRSLPSHPSTSETDCEQCACQKGYQQPDSRMFENAWAAHRVRRQRES